MPRGNPGVPRKSSSAPNEYIIQGDTTIIVLSQGQYAVIETPDLPLVEHFRWYAWRNKTIKTFYVRANLPRHLGKKGGAVYLHRILLDDPEGMEIDHKNGDGLNNLRSNLRAVTRTQNAQNLHGLRQDNSSGARNVTYFKPANMYRVDVQGGGRKATRYFPFTPEGLEQAKEEAIVLRMEMQTHSEGR